jgi:hypothetical protein
MKAMPFLLPMLMGFSPAFAQTTAVKPYDIFNNFTASGYMGDATSIKMVLRHIDAARPDSFCVKAQLIPGKLGWGGVYWQSPANCWDNCKGKNLAGRGFTKVTLWVRGEKGGEEVKFKVGQSSDTFTSDEETVTLTKTWSKVTIDITGQNLSNIAGALCWVVDSKAHGGAPVIFYLDNAQFE